MIANIAQLTIIITIVRRINEKQFLIDKLNCDSVSWNVNTDDEIAGNRFFHLRIHFVIP